MFIEWEIRGGGISTAAGQLFSNAEIVEVYALRVQQIHTLSSRLALGVDS